MIQIAVLNQKGGSGKTTTAVNLSGGLADAGQRVLLVDMDPQANATTHLGLVPDPERSTHALIMRRAEAKDLVQPTSRATREVIASHLSLSNAEMELASAVGREHRLARMIQPIANNYDFLLFDGPPTLGLFPIQVMCASRVLLVPIASDPHGVDGLRGLLASVKHLRSELGLPLDYVLPFLTRFDPRKLLHKEVQENLRSIAKMEPLVRPLETTIRENVRLAEASSKGMDVLEYDRASNGAADYAALTREVMNVCENTSH